jgi:hypothetical protein
MDLTQIITASISLVGTLGASFIANKKLKVFMNKRRGASKLNELIEKSYSENTIKDLLDQLKEEYGADRVLLYYFHNGTKAANGYSFYKMSCLYESLNRNLFTPVGQDHQSLPIMLLMDFLVHYKEKGIVNCPDRDNYTGDIRNMQAILESQNVQSTYSMLFYDLDGKPACTLVMNFITQKVEVTDLEFFKKVGYSCGTLLTTKNNY